MAWCLLPTEAQKFKKALKSGEINPEKLVAMTSAERNAFLAKFVGVENAKQVNALFEGKLLLKNQKAGMITWAKSVSGISPKVRRDMVAKIERMQNILDPADQEKFLNDLVDTRLRVDVTQEEAKNIADLSKAITEAKKTIKPDYTFPSTDDKFNYGANVVSLENYIKELKLQNRSVSLRQEPVRFLAKGVGELPGIFKSLVASMDNSFFGRQGIKTLLDFKTTPIWIKGFARSWVNLGKQVLAKGKWYTSGDDAVMDAIKADIYSRPNALNGKYKIGGYGLEAMTEEAYPTSLPEKIPFLGRLFKASEVAYNGGALRLRADLADRFIRIAENNGINTLDKTEAVGLGHLVSSMTGRGKVASLSESGQGTANVLFFSIKFLKSNVDTLTAHMLDPGATPYARKESAKSLLRIIASLSAILTVAKTLDPDSVDLDPRGGHTGQIKIWGHWTDISGGMGSLVSLASRLVPTLHNGKLGFWTKAKSGEYKNMFESGYGQQTALDVANGFLMGKLSPVMGAVRDVWAGQDFQGNKPTPSSVVENLVLPLTPKDTLGFLKDPNSSFVLGSTILSGLGFSVSSAIAPNITSKIIPENKSTKNEDLISMVATYAEAVGTDPETAFNRIFTGQKITKVDQGHIMVERMPLEDSQAIKKRLGGNNPSMKLDHTIPVKLFGDNSYDPKYPNDPYKSNLKLVTTSQWSSYTPIENKLIIAYKAGKISITNAQKLIIDFKAGKITKEAVLKAIQ
jgi:hypothetical protein